MNLFRRRLMLSTANNSNSTLPSGYIKLSYIESTGTQYIKLDLPITKDTICRIKFNMTEVTGKCIMGTTPKFRFFNALGNAYLDWGRGSGGGRIDGGSIKAGTLYDIEFGDFYVKNLDTGENIISGKSWGDTIQYYSDPIMIMKYKDSQEAKGKVYYSQVYETGTLVRDLLPCINPQGEIGLYDLVTKQFFGNAGTGSFTAGH